MKVLLLVCISLLPSIVNAGSIISLDETSNNLSINSYIEILEDSSHQWKIEDIVIPENTSNFQLSNRKDLNFGYTSSVYWARFTLRNNTLQHKMWFLEISNPHLDSIIVYRFDGDREMSIQEAGDLLPFKQRSIEHPNFVFKVPLNSGESEAFYIRFQNASAMRFPTTIWSPEEFSEKIQIKGILFGAFYGIIFIMVIYNLFLYVSLGDRSYLYYVLYIAFYGLGDLCTRGIDYQLFWPDAPYWKNRSQLFFIGISEVWLILFSKRFLNLPTIFPKLNRWYSFLLFITLALALIPFVYKSYYITNAIGFVVLFVAISVLMTGVSAVKRGFAPARLFTIALSTFVVGAIVYALSRMSLLPVNTITKYGIQFGAVIEISLLSLALADRINILKKEKNRAQKDKLEAQRILNEELESTVESRTIELKKTNENLQNAFDQVKQLKGLIPICASCKKIRDDKGYWNQLESYIEKHSDAQFSHGVCEECAEKIYGEQEWYQKRKNEGKL